jgi:hypothetical protein
MKIILGRKVEMKKAVVYLSLESGVARPDIQNYLKSGQPFANDVVERRVRDYLHRKGILGAQNQLTTFGQKVVSSGIMPETEEGKYQIWYTINDPLFGNRIFYFNRVKPEKMIRPDDLVQADEQMILNTSFFSLPINGRDGRYGHDSIEFTVKYIAPYKEARNAETIDCQWTWTDLLHSSFTFNGTLEEKIRINKEKSVDLKIDLNQWIYRIIPNWNSTTGRCKLKIENISTDDIYRYFSYSGSRSREGFDVCRYENLPVEPYDAEEARIWRNWLLKSEIETRYIHPDDYSAIVDDINRKEGFFSYSDTLDVPEIRSFIDGELDHGKKSDRNAAYWHLAAPLDLIPDMPQSLRIDSFSLRQGETISFREIAEKFTAGFSVDKVFYFDNYVVNYFQQRSVAVLLESFGAAAMSVITDKNNQNYSDYMSKNKPHIIVEDISGVYPNRKDAPHDRYIVLRHNGNLRVWTGTNSIDYIRFSGGSGDIYPDTPGNVQKSVTFTLIKPDVLEERLFKYISKG